MSMYAKDSKSPNGYLEVVSDIDGSIGEKEVDAWNTISTVIHVAAQSEMQGNWQTMHRIHPTLKKKEFDTIAKREKEFRIQKSKNVDDSTKSAKLAEAARNAHAKTRDKAFSQISQRPILYFPCKVLAGLRITFYWSLLGDITSENLIRSREDLSSRILQLLTSYLTI
ncbi:hypothetical protein EYC84_009153 [Monilinia fructicola]|uniref:Uncharacterized protein n=1 Tax=Monilinia fructicola TaxID=38448 RepID=A0A5M9JCZ1_MONFR|nr:hypothetical protein EYC84_009153 [Monilinia fructicola]